MPFVFNMRCRTGHDLRYFSISIISGWILGSHPVTCMRSGEDSTERRVAEIPFSRLRRMIADITLHITLIIDIKECKAWMILMLRTNSTIKWTTTKNWSQCFFWKIWLLEIIITEFVIIIIGRNSTI